MELRAPYLFCNSLQNLKPSLFNQFSTRGALSKYIRIWNFNIFCEDYKRYKFEQKVNIIAFQIFQSVVGRRPSLMAFTRVRSWVRSRFRFGGTHFCSTLFINIRAFCQTAYTLNPALASAAPWTFCWAADVVCICLAKISNFKATRVWARTALPRVTLGYYEWIIISERACDVSSWKAVTWAATWAATWFICSNIKSKALDFSIFKYLQDSYEIVWFTFYLKLIMTGNLI